MWMQFTTGRVSLPAAKASFASKIFFVSQQIAPLLEVFAGTNAYDPTLRCPGLY